VFTPSVLGPGGIKPGSPGTLIEAFHQLLAHNVIHFDKLSSMETMEFKMQQSSQSSVAVIGAGKVGSTIVDLLTASGDYSVTLIDNSSEKLDEIVDLPGLRKISLNATDTTSLAQELSGQFAVLSAAPFYLTTTIATASKQAGAHYLDLTEDVASTQLVRNLANGARTAFIPQCGLAPGYISIVTNNIASRFESLESIRMCVGALPQYPSNALNYNLTWSTDGVINEYCEPCHAIQFGKLVQVPPLEQLEHFAMDGITYESFNTSGGIGTLAETFAGRVKHLSYKTIRYPGHRDIMKTLLHDLNLRENRSLLKSVLENAVPMTLQDVVVIFVTISGRKGGRLVQETHARKIYSTSINGRQHSAIQITTASAICVVLDLLRDGELPSSGFVTQEQIDLNQFQQNRFGRYFA